MAKVAGKYIAAIVMRLDYIKGSCNYIYGYLESCVISYLLPWRKLIYCMRKCNASLLLLTKNEAKNSSPKDLHVASYKAAKDI